MDKCTQVQLDKAQELLEEGCYEDVAYVLTGIGKTAWYQWKREARKLRDQLESGDRMEGSVTAAERKLLDFLTMVETAKMQGVYNHVKNVKAAGANPDKWQASAWYLERTRPEQFGRKDSLKVRGAMVHASLGLTAEEEAEFKENLLDMFPGLASRGREPDVDAD